MAKNIELFGPQTVPTTPATHFTVPTGQLVVVRYFSCTNPNSSAQTIRVSLGADAAGTRILEEVIPANTTINRAPGWTLAAADILQCSCPGSNNTLIAYCGGLADVA